MLQRKAAAILPVFSWIDLGFNFPCQVIRHSMGPTEKDTMCTRQKYFTYNEGKARGTTTHSTFKPLQHFFARHNEVIAMTASLATIFRDVRDVPVGTFPVALEQHGKLLRNFELFRMDCQLTASETQAMRGGTRYDGEKRLSIFLRISKRGCSISKKRLLRMRGFVVGCLGLGRSDYGFDPEMSSRHTLDMVHYQKSRRTGMCRLWLAHISLHADKCEGES